jgi:hypothetical protein
MTTFKFVFEIQGPRPNEGAPRAIVMEKSEIAFEMTDAQMSTLLKSRAALERFSALKDNPDRIDEAIAAFKEHSDARHEFKELCEALGISVGRIFGIKVADYIAAEHDRLAASGLPALP